MLPIVIDGARAKMPSGVMLPRPGPLGIHVCEPLSPDDFGSMKYLAAAARRSLLEHLREPDLEAAATALRPPADETEKPMEAGMPGAQDQPLWTPSPERAKASAMAQFMEAVREQ